MTRVRRLLPLAAVAALLAWGPETAIAQSEWDGVTKADAPKGPPPARNVRPYHDASIPKDTGGIGLMGVVMLVVLFGGSFLGVAIWFRKQTRELDIPEDEQALAAQGLAGGVGVSPKEAVYSAVSRAGGWVTPGRIALGAGLPTTEVESHLEGLVRDGRVKAGRDKRGRVLYRAAG